MKRLLPILFAIMLLGAFAAGSAHAAGESGETIQWSPVKTGTYDPLHLYTLNWSGDVLDRGGLSLSTLKAASAKEADIVINQYGAMGAEGILKLQGDGLTDATSGSLSGFTNSVTIETKAVYLVRLHDGKMAKIRIDQLSAKKATFSYVLEVGRAAASVPPAQDEPKPAKPAPDQPGQSQQPAPSASTGQQPKPAGNETNMPSSTTKQWSETYEVPGVPNNQPLSIYLTVDSTYAVIYEKNGQRKDYKLHASPFLHEGNTMVPARFISEALGAKVGWREEEQQITIVNDKAIIAMQLHNKQAIVNDKTYELVAAPMTKDGSTVIPLRFVSEHLNMFVYFDNGTILITDTERPSSTFSPIGDVNAAPDTTNTGEAAESPAGKESSTVLLGKWELWVPGGYAPTGTTVNGDGSKTTTSAYMPGASASWIDIHADGTYEWLDLGKTYTGKWSGSGGRITLIAGPMDSDWTMRHEGEGSAKIFAWGLEYIATKAVN
ncbi:hypothetical protein FE783_25620 [Paenibacillus mesophilus]|uniref:stalk domain-containing protein n=1 Tax=Paenibacillus mesophilus TaxID=2582849 RepID=UPI00110D567C|nr:stalk domain-containing protein [Paenibacillus mesophilus]TMV46687.1 hypothetical protein FE783_25620 [Paenibacillus mesophilus]